MNLGAVLSSDLPDTFKWLGALTTTPPLSSMSDVQVTQFAGNGDFSMLPHPWDSYLFCDPWYSAVFEGTDMSLGLTIKYESPWKPVGGLSAGLSAEDNISSPPVESMALLPYACMALDDALWCEDQVKEGFPGGIVPRAHFPAMAELFHGLAFSCEEYVHQHFNCGVPP